jgi:hypothetical protein
MKTTSPHLLIAIYSWVFAVFIVFGSVNTIVAVHKGSEHHGHAHALVLATVEIFAAVLFGFRATRGIAGVLLLTVFVIAAVITAMSGTVPANLLLYAATVSFVVVLERSPMLERRVNP